MKKHLSTILLVLLMLVGLSVMLYPTVSNWWNSKTQSRAITEYVEAVSTMSEDEIDALWAQADDYNARLRQLQYPYAQYDSLTDYDTILNVGGNGIIGYVTIDKINVELPIYHGTASTILNWAAGHLEGSSLPVGGASTHSVLSAHRALPEAKLFTDLDKMEVGDTFTITVLNRVLTYQVDQVLIVLPSEMDDLTVAEGSDYCTLQTCTPYGINSHRLLVRGKRMEGADQQIQVTSEAMKVNPLIVTPIVALPILLILLGYLLYKYRRRNTHTEVTWDWHRKK